MAITMDASRIQVTRTVGVEARYTYAREDTPECDWYVDGVLGGNAEKGTITQANPATYSAPSAVPPSGRVAISAVDRSNSAFTAADTLEVAFTIYYVDDASGEDAPGGGTWSAPLKTISYALGAADTGDTVEVLPGTYSGAGNRDLDFGGAAIVLRGEDGARSVTIDCEGAGRGFHFYNGEDAASVVTGLTITNGQAEEGGGVRCIGSSPTFTNCTFSGNSAGVEGGGMYLMDASPTIVDCVFSGNSSLDGCGIFSRNGSPTITDCAFSGNSGGFGGGMYCRSSSPTIAGCSFTDNLVDFEGGGVLCHEDSSPTLSDCTFSGNAAQSGGGVSCVTQSSPALTDCLFSGNSAEIGGGLRLDASSPSLMRCTFAENTADTGGGMFGVSTSYPELTNCTFYGNGATEGGGAYCAWGTSPTFANCIIAFGTSGAAVECVGAASAPLLSCSDVYGNTDGDWAYCIADQADTNGNIAADPLFCDAPGGDFTIDAASPCTDANNPGGCGLIGAWDVGCGSRGR